MASRDQVRLPETLSLPWLVRLGRTLYVYRLSYAFILPAFALAIVFSYYPAFVGLAYAFTNWQPGLQQTDFVGLENFRLMWEDRYLHAGARNLVILLIATIGKYITIPFVVAELVYHIRPHSVHYWLRTLFVTPLVVPSMATILLWGQIYHPNTGLVNQVVSAVGASHLAHAWLGDERTALAAIVFIGFPWVVVLPFLIFMGGLMNLSSEILDAARVDGISAWRRIWAIDIPLLTSQFKLCAILGFIFQMQGFWFILVLTGGGPIDATYTPALEMYYAAFRFGKYGYASAIALVLFVIIMIGTILNMSLIRSDIEYDAH